MLLRVTVLTALFAVLLAGLVSGSLHGNSPGTGTSAQGQSGTSATAPSSTKGGAAPPGFERFMPQKPSQVVYTPFRHDRKTNSNSCCYELNSPGEECPSLRPITMMVVTSQSKDTLQANAVSGTDAVKQPDLKWRCCTNDYIARGPARDQLYIHCHGKSGTQFWRVPSPNSFEYNQDWDNEED